MQVTLEIRSGPFAGNKIRLKPGQLLRLGRTSKADLAFPDDSHMSGVHFVVECDAETCRVRDLNSRNGTLVNGLRADVAVLEDGDEILAGETHFSVRIESEEGGAPPTQAGEAPVGAAAPEGAKPEERLLSMLRKDFQPLYAILDAARSPNIYKFLVEAKEESEEVQYESLFEGKAKAELTYFAPYLVRLSPEATLLEKLVDKGWGKSWGVYLTCDKALKEVRTHFRHFLMVKLPDNRQVYFRYYDPRVLRLFLPTCTAEEINMFFGPVKYYLMEDEKPGGLLRFSNSGRGVGLRKFPLVPEEKMTAGEPAGPGSKPGA